MITAALDIGSNSIHLVVVEIDGEKSFRVLASGKEMVRLGRSVARDRKLSANAMNRAVEAISKFSLRARECKATEIIAVATSATREALNRDEFLERVVEETGVHIDLLSGIEEARLIALAVVAKQRPRARQRLLAIDIGGGSTEVSISHKGEPVVLISFDLGAVRITEQFITGDPISEKQLRRLRSVLRAVIAHRAPEITKLGFDLCFGTSGTINALGQILWHRFHAEKRATPAYPVSGLPVRLDDLRVLNEEMALLDLDARSEIPGLNRARAEIIVAGGQLLEALMETLKIDELMTCEWALREGVILAQLARRASAATASSANLERDPSLRGALALVEHFQSDRKHATKVAHLAQHLFDSLRPLHLLGTEYRRLLVAAALLHDIGKFVSHTNHHKHSAYLIGCSDLTGFMTSEVKIIANLARYHRSSLPKPKHPYYAALAEADREVVRKLSALLRVADALDRDHEGRVRSLTCSYDDKKVSLTAVCSRVSDATQYRIEDRSDLFSEVFGRKIEFEIKLAG